MNRVLIITNNSFFPKNLLESENYKFYMKETVKEGIAFLNTYNVLAVVLCGEKPSRTAFSVLEKNMSSERIPIIAFCPEEKIGEAFSLGATEVFYGKTKEGFLAVLKKAINGGTLLEKHKEVEVGEFKISLSGYSLSISGKTIKMPKKEIELLYKLSLEPERVFSRNELLDEVWGVDFEGDPRTVDVHILRIRKKIAFFDKVKIKTVPRAGYCISFEDLKVL